MRIIKPRTLEDVVICVEMYANLNDHSFVKISKERSLRYLLQACKQNKFVRILLNQQDEIEAWIYADVFMPFHSDEKMLQQIYYASNKEGVKAYRHVVSLHEAMLDEARLRNISLAISQGSHMDETNVFSRILEKSGWERRGHTALKRLN
jgi:hypothetical protein